MMYFGDRYVRRIYLGGALLKEFPVQGDTPFGMQGLLMTTALGSPTLSEVAGAMLISPAGLSMTPLMSSTELTLSGVAYEGAVARSSIGQSNEDGTNSMANVPDATQGVYDRVQLADARHLTNPGSFPDAYYPLTVVKAGQTVDGVTGEVIEARGGGNGVSSLFGLAQFITDTAAGSPLFPGASELLVFKQAMGGQPQSSFLPGGGQWNSYENTLKELLPEKIAAAGVRFTHLAYAQGEREAVVAVEAAEISTGSTAMADVVPVALADDTVTGWAQRHVQNRRAMRDQLGLPSLAYVIKGMVLPSTDPYANNQERVREGIAQQHKNLARWNVRLNEAEDGIILTDLAGNAQTVTWNTGTDEPVLVDAGPSIYRDDNTYYIDARGYVSTDSLHHDVTAQLKIGAAEKFLLNELYGVTGIPTSANDVAAPLPYFYALPAPTTITSADATFAFTSSDNGTAYIGAYASGSPVPTDAQIIGGTGTGFIARGSASAVRRVERSVTVAGLTAETTYDRYAVVEQGDGGRSVVSPVASFTTDEFVAPAEFDLTAIASLTAWQHARDLTVGNITDAANLADKGGATVTATNLDAGSQLAEVLLNPQGAKMLRIYGAAGNMGTRGRQRLDLGHADLGTQFTMVALIQRAAPSTGAFIAVGVDNAVGGVRAAFFYSDKSAAGGYGTGRQWGLSQTSPIAANDTNFHLVAIVSDGTAAGTAGDPTTKVYVDGATTFPTVGDPDAVPNWNAITRIGQGASNSTNNYDTTFTDFAIFNGVLSLADRQKVEGYMAHQAARLDLLPVDHPYKTDPPT